MWKLPSPSRTWISSAASQDSEHTGGSLLCSMHGLQLECLPASGKGVGDSSTPRAGNGMEAAQEIRVTLLGCSLARAATDSQFLFRHCSLLHPLFPQHPLPGLPRGMRNAGNAAAGTAGATFQLFSTASPPVPWKPGSCGFLWACLASPGSRDSLECLSILRE